MNSLEDQIKLVKNIKGKERRPLFQDAFLEMDSKGLLYYTTSVPDYLMPNGTRHKDPYTLDGIHMTIWDLVARDNKEVP